LFIAVEIACKTGDLFAHSVRPEIIFEECVTECDSKGRGRQG